MHKTQNCEQKKSHQQSNTGVKTEQVKTPIQSKHIYSKNKIHKEGA